MRCPCTSLRMKICEFFMPDHFFRLESRVKDVVRDSEFIDLCLKADQNEEEEDVLHTFREQKFVSIK